MKKQFKTRKGLSSKSTRHNPQNGVYSKRPKDMEYAHNDSQVSNTNTQVTTTLNSCSTGLPNWT